MCAAYERTFERADGLEHFLFGDEVLAVGANAFCIDIHLLGGRVVEELHGGVSVGVGLDGGLPEDGASEVVGGDVLGIVLGLECRRHVETLEMSLAQSFVAGRGECGMGIDENHHGVAALDCAVDQVVAECCRILYDIQ